MGLKKFFKKVGKVAKKALPFAAAALPFIPGVGGIVSSAVKGIGGLFGGSPEAGGGSAQSFPVRSEGQPPPESSAFDWNKALQTAVPLVTGGLNYLGQRDTNVANAQQAQQQMDFQKEMSNTSYQRGTADMKAAGLNPLLAYSQGGASVPGGAMASMGNELGEGVNSAWNAKMQMQQLQAIEANTEQTRAETQYTLRKADTEVARRQDILEGIPNHPTGRAYTEAGTRGRNINNETDRMRQQLLADTYADQILQIQSNARQHAEMVEQIKAQTRKFGAETARTYADIPYIGTRGDIAERIGGYLRSGDEAIHSAKEWAGEKMRPLGGHLIDLQDAYMDWQRNRGKDFKRYGTPAYKR